MKILLEYNPVTNIISDKNGMTLTITGVKGFKQKKKKDSIVLDLVREGVKPEEIIKLKNSKLI